MREAPRRFTRPGHVTRGNLMPVKFTCAASACERPRRKREWCQTHYTRWQKYGDPNAAPYASYAGEPVGTRLFHKFEVDSRGCWLWTGFINRYGYGVLTALPRKPGRARARAAHRVSYEWFVGPIPAGLTIDHLCRVRRCINPDHLEPVTNAENLRRGRVSRSITADAKAPAGVTVTIEKPAD